MVRTLFRLVFAAALLAAAFAFPARTQADEARASATIRNAAGETIGLATFFESSGGDVTLTVDVTDLSPGLHGMHVHSVGQCAPADFTSAGAHFNPLNRKHGLQTSDGPHAGDLPNLVVDAGGRGHFQMTVGRFSLNSGATRLLDSDGSAIVIHAMPDDEITDPIGNSGGRIACGVLAASPAAAVVTQPLIPAVQLPPAVVVAPPNTGDAGLVVTGSFACGPCDCCCCDE